jgi:hypothetical protein
VETARAHGCDEDDKQLEASSSASAVIRAFPLCEQPWMLGLKPIRSATEEALTILTMSCGVDRAGKGTRAEPRG